LAKMAGTVLRMTVLWLKADTTPSL